MCVHSPQVGGHIAGKRHWSLLESRMPSTMAWSQNWLCLVAVFIGYLIGYAHWRVLWMRPQESMKKNLPLTETNLQPSNSSEVRTNAFSLAWNFNNNFWHFITRSIILVNSRVNRFPSELEHKYTFIELYERFVIVCFSSFHLIDPRCSNN